MLRHLPSVTDLLEQPAILELCAGHGRLLVTKWVRQAIDEKRAAFRKQSDQQSEIESGVKDAAAVRDLLRIELLEAVASNEFKESSTRPASFFTPGSVVLRFPPGRNRLCWTRREHATQKLTSRPATGVTAATNSIRHCSF